MTLHLAGVLANVVLLNFCYDVGVKLHSLHLVALAFLLVAPHVPRLVNLLLLNRPTAPVELRPFPAQRTWVRRTALAVKILLVLVYAILPIVMSYQAAELYGFLHPRHALAGVYRVTAITRAGGLEGARMDDGTPRWLRLAVNESGRGMAIQRADGTTQWIPLTIDAGRRVWTLQEGRLRGRAPRLPCGGEWRRHARRDHRVRPRPGRADAAGRKPAAGRGFHWIDETLNR